MTIAECRELLGEAAPESDAEALKIGEGLNELARLVCESVRQRRNAERLVEQEQSR